MLIALAVLATVAAVVLQVFSQGLRTLGVSDRYGLAALHAQSVLAATGRETPLRAGETGGRFEDGFVWHRRVEIDASAALLPPAAAVVPYRVTVTVGWGGAQPTAEVTLTSLRIAGRDGFAPVPEDGGR